MRFFTIVLSFFVLMLSIAPCSDVENCNQEDVELTADHTDHQHEQDFCSPFCICACCGCSGFIVSVPFFQMQGKGFRISKLIVLPDFEFVSSFYYSFWQPPKLS
ncbi:MAG: hypothetical protein K2Q22_12000 [Cytophagales bacterium]|nr:hypothetical protein [Cytophagales bacterium]